MPNCLFVTVNVVAVSVRLYVAVCSVAVTVQRFEFDCI